MDNLFDATHQAMKLLVSGDQELWDIIGISFRVSTLAITLATIPALLVAFLLSYTNFPGRRTQSLHFRNHEFRKGIPVQNGFRLLEKEGFVGRASSFGDEKKLVAFARRCVKIDLSRKVAGGVFFFVQGERSHLRIAKAIPGISPVDSPG